MGEKAAVVGQLRRNLSVAAIHSQCLSLHGRLETLAPGPRECAKQGDRDVQHSWAMDSEAGQLRSLTTPIFPEERLRES